MQERTDMFEDLKAMIEQLPPEAEEEIRERVELLLKKHRRNSRKKLKLDWAGGLEEFRDRFTAISLQKKSLEWWTN